MTQPQVCPWGEPFERFSAWYEEAAAQEVNDPDAMTLATVDAEGRPSARIILLKGLDERGFVFYTNLNSRKGEQLRANQNVALCFHWKSLRKQVRIEGPVERVTDAESDAYYATRSRGSRLGAWASDQSQPLDSREALMRRWQAFDAQYPGDDIPRPPHWGGHRVLPQRIELWQDGEFRLHQRWLYTANAARDGWDMVMLNP